MRVEARRLVAAIRGPQQVGAQPVRAVPGYRGSVRLTPGVTGEIGRRRQPSREDAFASLKAILGVPDDHYVRIVPKGGRLLLEELKPDKTATGRAWSLAESEEE